MGQQPIPGKKSGRQKKPDLALPSDILSILLILMQNLKLITKMTLVSWFGLSGICRKHLKFGLLGP